MAEDDDELLFPALGSLGDFIADLPWPVTFFSSDDLPGFLDQVTVLDFEANAQPGAESARVWLGFPGEIVLDVPGMDGVHLVIGGELDTTSTTATASSTPAAAASLPPPALADDPGDEDDLDEIPPDDPIPTDETFFDDDSVEEPDDPDLTGLSFIQVEFFLGANPSLRFSNITIALRFDSDILAPADPSEGPVEIVATGSIAVDSTFNVTVDGFDSLSLNPAIIGSSGITVSADGVAIDLSRTSSPQAVFDAGFDESFLGIVIGDAKITLPAGMLGGASETLELSKTVIGSGGVSGTATLTHEDPPVPTSDGYSGDRAGTLFGVPFWLSDLSLTLKANAFVNASVNGELVLPFLDKRTQVKLSFDGNGGFTAQITAIDGQTGTGGVFTVDVVPGIKFDILSLEIDEEGGKGLFKLKVKIKLDSTVGNGINWPTPEIDGLTIDSDGHVRIEGGWIDLPKQLALNLYAFKAELTKIGFGTDDDGVHRWIGFSGGLKIVDGVQAGASVDGLKIHYHGTETPTVSLDGVGIQLSIPGVVSAKGSVSLKNKEFSGGLQVTIDPLQLTLAGQFVSGSLPTGEKTFGIFLDAELPAGMPLGTTGLGIYGMAGLYAENREPDKHSDEGWYQNPDGSPGWYLRKVPPANQVGVTDLGGKWKGNLGSRGFGAGVTLGTFGDNGYKFNGRVLLVLVFPGPTIIIEGKANLFKKRAALEGDDPTFRALAVIEPGVSFLLSLDAHYKYKTNGEVMDLRGSAEAFFDFGNPTNWHVILGFKDDPNRRIRARLFKLFDVSSYFELRSTRLDVGASWSFDKSWSFGSLGVHVMASLDEAATVSWHPNHFTGTLNLQGKAELKAFGHGVGVSAGAKVQGDVFDPFHLKGDFHVGIDLPWPLPDIGATVTLEWTEALSVPAPPLPLPLQDVSAEFGGWQSDSGTPPRPLRWPFARGTNLLPSYDQGDGEAGHGQAPGGDATDAVFAAAPVIPSDAQIGLTFSRPVGDPGMVGNNPSTVPKELIGDPFNSTASDGYRIDYTLSSLTLEKIGALAPGETAGGPLPPQSTGVGWVTVAVGGASPTTGQTQLFGSWTQAPPDNPPDPTAPPSESVADPSVSSVQTTIAEAKLMVGAKSPFEYTALSSQSWDDWFAQTYPNYPCAPFDPNENVADVYTQPLGTDLGFDFSFTNPPFDVSVTYGGDVTNLDPATIQGVLGPIDRGERVAMITGSAVTVTPPPGSTEVRIRVATPAVPTQSPNGIGVFSGIGTVSPASPIYGGTVSVTTFDQNGTPLPTTSNQVVKRDGHQGLDVEFGVELMPQVSAFVVDLQLFAEADPDVFPTAVVNVFSATDNQNPVATFNADPNNLQVRFHAADIARVRMTVTAGSFLLESVYFRTPVVATASSTSDPNAQFGPFTEVDGLVTVQGTNLGEILLSMPLGGEFVIIELSIPSRQDTIIRHTIASLAQFATDDAVFQPDTNYRMVLKTSRGTSGSSKNLPPSSAGGGLLGADDFVETIYFRTAQLPGVGVPDAPGGTDAGGQVAQPSTGFEDLSFYVSRTVPAVPAPAGGHTSPARGFYRAYDINAEFTPNAVHVQLMYEIGKRDLTLRLFDGNNVPIRDVNGLIALGSSSWGESDDPSVSQTASRWVGIVSKASCAPTPPPGGFSILNGEQLASQATGLLLDAQKLYQARLVPMLLHESFQDVRTGQVADGQSQLDLWHAEQTGATWEIQPETVDDPTTGQPAGTEFFAVVTSANPTALVYHGPLASQAATTEPDHPSQWSDVRASVQLRWQDGQIGFEVRRASATSLLRVTLDRAAGTQQLISVSGTVTNVLAQNTQVTFPGTTSDVILTVECVGDAVQVFQSLAGDPLGSPILTASGAPTQTGTVALFSNGATSPEFTEVSVHDLRTGPSTAYRFDFITSAYANFYHHLGSYDDQLFEVPASLGVGNNDVGQALPAAFVTPTAVGAPTPAGGVQDPEERAFEALEILALGAGAASPPETVQVLNASNDPTVTALLVRSPEPIQWERTALLVETTSTPLPIEVPPGAFKLTEVTFSGGDPNLETVTILLRQGGAVSGYSIDWRPIPDASNAAPAWTPYFTFGTEDPLGDGNQVRILSGAPDTIPHDVGITLRFVASDPTQAQVQFPAAGVELRLRDPSGNTIHQRAFLPDTAFTAVAVGAVRKVDGSAFFILPTASTPAPTALRLRLSFIRAVVGDLPALRQAGSDAAEEIVLDVPLG